MMILVISATYLCRRGDIDNETYFVVVILGLFEIIFEIALLASALGK